MVGLWTGEVCVCQKKIIGGNKSDSAIKIRDK